MVLLGKDNPVMLKKRRHSPVIFCQFVWFQTAKRGTVSAPCTPGRNLQEDYSPCLQQRIQRLHTVNVQRDLEDQAKSFQSRIDTLRLQSQIRSGDSSFRNDRISKTRLSSTSSTTQVVSACQVFFSLPEFMLSFSRMHRFRNLVPEAGMTYLSQAFRARGSVYFY